MQPNKVSVHSLQTRKFDLDKTTKRIKLTDVFYTQRPKDINDVNLFIAHFNAIPNYIHEVDIKCEKASEWFVKNYEKDIVDVYYNKRYFNSNKNAEYEDVFYFLYDDLIVNFDHNTDVVRFLFRKTDISKIEKIVSSIKKFKDKNKGLPEISLLVHTKDGFEISNLEIAKPRLSIEDNYNDDFREIHQTILKRLSKPRDKGIVLLHGKPGTGKTSCIRYLIATVKKKIIFLPPNMANALTSPDLMPILIENQNSILIIEDAENIVIDREQNGSSPVSALLNISGGLLSDCLNIQIVCSFNTDVSKIDKALLRKGRLIAKYDFKDLVVDKANMLSKKLGYKTTFISPMPLTAIYNQDEKEFAPSEKRKAIGFQSRSVG